MCSCHEYGKRFPTNGVYYGRVGQSPIKLYVKPEAMQALAKNLKTKGKSK